MHGGMEWKGCENIAKVSGSRKMGELYATYHQTSEPGFTPLRFVKVLLNSQITFLGHLDSIAGVGELYDPEKKGFYTLQAMRFCTRWRDPKIMAYDYSLYKWVVHSPSITQSTRFFSVQRMEKSWSDGHELSPDLSFNHFILWEGDGYGTHQQQKCRAIFDVWVTVITLT